MRLHRLAKRPRAKAPKAVKAPKVLKVWTPKEQVKRERAADLRMRRTYHITLAEYMLALSKQDGKCAICRKRPGTGKVRLAIDHCHATGEVRGLICSSCNRAIAVFRDNPDLLFSAAEYLRTPPFRSAMGAPRFTAPGRVGTKRRAKLLLQMSLQMKAELAKMEGQETK